MQWHLIKKDANNFPDKGTYIDWKPQLSLEGNNQCVYCSLHEARFGGERNFHVEHFRPKSKFPELENDYANLFFSCSICNIFKGCDWPSEPCDEYNLPAYIDPSKHDYNLIFDFKNYNLVSKYISPNYMIERLYLNRPQLIIERRISHLSEMINNLNDVIPMVIEKYRNVKDDRLRKKIEPNVLELISLLSNSMKLMSDLNKVKPYKGKDVSRIKRGGA